MSGHQDQLCLGERFGNEMHPFFQHAVIGDNVFRLARHTETVQIRIRLLQLVVEIKTTRILVIFIADRVGINCRGDFPLSPFRLSISNLYRVKDNRGYLHLESMSVPVAEQPVYHPETPKSR
jgi:hypothetical protein